MRNIHPVTPGELLKKDFLEPMGITQYRLAKEIGDRGIRPESLPPAEDVKKVERRLTSDEKKALKNPDGLEE